MAAGIFDLIGDPRRRMRGFGADVTQVGSPAPAVPIEGMAASTAVCIEESFARRGAAYACGGIG